MADRDGFGGVCGCVSAPDPGQGNARLVSDAFYQAILEGNDAKAQGMSREGEFPHGFARLRARLDIRKGGIHKVWAGKKDACAVTTFMPIKGAQGKAAFGLGLCKVGDRWIVRDLDYLPNQQALETFVAGFRQVAPSAFEIMAAK